jgi:PGF-pre-PGF domain-containing protein
LTETWSGEAKARVQWYVVEGWTGAVKAFPIYLFRLIESWRATVKTPAIDFIIGVSPGSGEVMQGRSTTAIITLTSIGEYDYAVTLTASGQPGGVAIGFAPENGTPPFTSTMTIGVSDFAPAGTYAMTITGTGADGTVHSTTYSLTIKERPAVPPISSVRPVEPYWRASVPFEITAQASDNDGIVASVALYYRYSADNSSWENWKLFGVDISEPWSWSFTAPDNDGYYEFYSRAKDNENNMEPSPAVADARCGVDTAAPATPSPISPADGTKTKANTPTFDWSDVIDLSTVKYDLEIEAYGISVLRKTGLTDSTYSLIPDEALPESAYSWRVRAVDEAGNVGDWSEAWSLTVEITPPVTVRLGTIPAGEARIADFTPHNIFVIRVTVTPLQEVSDVEVSIKESMVKPAWIPDPPGVVYPVFATVTTNIRSSDLGSSLVEFQLPRSWVEGNEIDLNTIKLLRFGSEWQELPTTLVGSDENFFRFTAETSGFSILAAAGERRITPPEPVPAVPPLLLFAVMGIFIGGGVAMGYLWIKRRRPKPFVPLKRIPRAVKAVRPREPFVPLPGVPEEEELLKLPTKHAEALLWIKKYVEEETRD